MKRCLTLLHGAVAVAVVFTAVESPAQRTRTFQPPLQYSGPPSDGSTREEVAPQQIRPQSPQQVFKYAGDSRFRPSRPQARVVGVRYFTPPAPVARIVGLRPLGDATLPRQVRSSIAMSPAIRLPRQPAQWASLPKPDTDRAARQMADVGFELSILPYGPPPAWTAQRQQPARQH